MKKLRIIILALALAFSMATAAMAEKPSVELQKYGAMSVVSRSKQTSTTSADVTFITASASKRIYMYRVTCMASSDATGLFAGNLSTSAGTTEAVVGQIVGPSAGVQYVLYSSIPFMERSNIGSLFEISIPAGANTMTCNYVYRQE